MYSSLLAALSLHIAAASWPENFRQYVLGTLRAPFLPGHLWTAPIILYPKESLRNSYCYNPSFTVLDGAIHAYLRCHSRDYFNPRYRRYHTTSWALIEGGMNRFVLSSLPYNISDLRSTVQDWTDIVQPLDQIPGFHPDNRFPGLQDARLFTFQDRIWFVACSQTWLESNKGVIDYGPVVGFLTEDRTAVEDLWMPRGMPVQARNVVPFVSNTDVYLLDVLKGQLHQLQGPDYRSAVEVLRFPSLADQGLRGGTNPVLLDEGRTLGLLAHSVYSLPVRENVTGFGDALIDHEYLHFWVELSVATGQVSVSYPFFLMGSGIEFASALLLSRDQRQVVIGVGFQDQEAWALGAALDDLRGMPRLLDDRAGASPGVGRGAPEPEAAPAARREGGRETAEGQERPRPSVLRGMLDRVMGTKRRGEDGGSDQGEF